MSYRKEQICVGKDMIKGVAFDWSGMAWHGLGVLKAKPCLGYPG